MGWVWSWISVPGMEGAEQAGFGRPRVAHGGYQARGELNRAGEAKGAVLGGWWHGLGGATSCRRRAGGDLLKPARHPHEGAQGGTGGGPRQQPQGHLVPGDPVGILAHDDVGHPGSCKAKRGVSWVAVGGGTPSSWHHPDAGGGEPLPLRGATDLGWRGTPIFGCHPCPLCSHGSFQHPLPTP